MRALPAQLLHKIFENRLHERVIFCGHGVDRHVAKENRVGAHAQIMLHFALNYLFARPAVLDDAVEPGVLFHGDFGGITPEFLYEFVELHDLRSSSQHAKCPFYSLIARTIVTTVLLTARKGASHFRSGSGSASTWTLVIAKNAFSGLLRKSDNRAL